MLCGFELGAWGNLATITLSLSTSQLHTRTCACVHVYVRMYVCCTPVRAHVHAILSDTARRVPMSKQPGCSAPQPCAKRADAGGGSDTWPADDHLPLHARCVLLGSAAKKKPLRLTQEPADAVLAASVDAATAAAGGVRSWADAKTWAPSLVLILDRKARLATGQPSSS